MRKILAALLALAMVLALVPAVMAEGEEPLTLTVFISDPGEPPTEDNKIYKLIEEKLGIKFEFEYVAGNLDESLGLKITNKDYADLFSGGNSADLIINGGALINLLDYVSPEKTPLLWEHFAAQKARLIDKDENGNDVLYIIPNFGLADGGQIVNTVRGPGFFIQKQVLEFNGYPQIKTLNDYFDAIEKFIDANPTDENGTPYVGFAILCDDWRHFCLINPVQHLMGRPNDGEVVVDINDPDLHTETFIDKPYAKIYYKKLNEEFNKGLIERDTFTDGYEANYIPKLSSGIVLGMFDQGWDFDTPTAALQDAGMYKNTYVGLGLTYEAKDLEGVQLPTENWQIEEHYVNSEVPNVRRGFGISVNCKCPERVVAMWEEFMKPEWQLIFNWGIVDEDYYIDENGRLQMTDEQYKNTLNSQWKLENKADGIFGNSPKRQGTILEDIVLEDGQVVKAGNCWEVGNQPEILFGQMDEYDKNFLAAYGYKKFSDFVNQPIELAPWGEAWQLNKEAVATEVTQFGQIQDKRLPELIMCDPAEFDAKWDEFVAEIGPAAKVYSEHMQKAVVEATQKFLEGQK
ncbi:hypothetical protein [Aristaeella hokkaidonensis]|uniref:Uncharacterized protein n=1 Tax=Aristaeella hokkaidonensis TaxID=3046382 RepID=A0AC61NKU7_9FIRM|nr:hypothetical protein [Aristaeella hokkaidonensis]QUC66863.1 hypothetical protein JYE49_13610 [Aristaeella hokkaidonensis]SNT94514.1 aldotetraouronic acid ABC transporter substrate-binding protein [Aristaeella hokkaidonensis]